MNTCWHRLNLKIFSKVLSHLFRFLWSFKRFLVFFITAELRLKICQNKHEILNYKLYTSFFEISVSTFSWDKTIYFSGIREPILFWFVQMKYYCMLLTVLIIEFLCGRQPCHILFELDGTILVTFMSRLFLWLVQACHF